MKHPGKKNVLKIIKKLEKKEYIKYACPNYIYTIDAVEDTATQEETAAVPNDPDYFAQFDLNQISAPDAWNITTGSGNVLVGVLDTGIDRTHPDLSSRVSTTLGKNFTDDGLGIFVDQVGHGTHVAGIIGAAGNNGTGISGVCWNVTMVSLKVFKKTVEDGIVKGTGDTE